MTSSFERSAQQRRQLVSRRALLLGGAQLGCFGLLGARLYQLQVIQADRYQTLANENRISVRFEVASRGLILDRYDQPMAVNRTTYRVAIVPEQVPDLTELLDRLDRLVPLAEPQRQRVLDLAARLRPFVAITVYESLSWQEVAKLAVHSADLPGVEIGATAQRIYPEGQRGAHLIGYVGAISKREMTDDPVLALADFRIGKSGVERVYDARLRGVAARKQVEVNAVGRTIRELAHTPEQPGETLRLSIDARLQAYAAERFGSDTGAAVVMDVRNGEVLAMASLPSYDPGLFTGGISHRDWNALLSAPDAPLVNKAIAGQYAPGSTYKMIVALAALESGLVNAQTNFHCSGVLELGKGKFHCWHRGGHGRVNLFDAIVQSCDVYFYEVARRVGIDRIAEMSRKFGLGEPLGIDLPSEQDGLIPTKAWKRRRFDRPWQVGETLVAGIGQGYVLTTPLQLATMTARMVNGGYAVVPHVLTGGAEPTPARIDVSGASLEAVKRAMVGVTTAAKGTAIAAQIEERALWMGGKTGTSQVRRISARERRTGVLRNEERPREERDHALFVGFAPLRAPRYAVAVIVEHGGGGSKAAAPIARDLLNLVQRRARGERGA